MLPLSDPASAALCTPDARVVVAGVSGSGTSTLARRLGERLGIPYTEMDALHWGPDWTSRPAFLDDVCTLVAGERWITEWQYTVARPLVIERATVLIWLDTPFPVTLARVVRRTLRRRRQREPLWGGDVEPGLPHALIAPEGIILWTIRTRAKYRRSVPRLRAERPRLPVIRLRSQRDVERLVAALPTAPDVDNSGAAGRSPT